MGRASVLMGTQEPTAKLVSTRYKKLYLYQNFYKYKYKTNIQKTYIIEANANVSDGRKAFT